MCIPVVWKQSLSPRGSIGQQIWSLGEVREAKLASLAPEHLVVTYIT